MISTNKKLSEKYKYKLVKPQIIPSTFSSNTGCYAIAVNLKENSNGDILEVYEDNLKIASENITKSAKTFNYNFVNKDIGTHEYKVIIKNSKNSLESDIIKIDVVISQNFTEYNNNKEYTMGDVVTFNGIIYQSQFWWISGEEPREDSDVWTVIGSIQEKLQKNLQVIASKYNKKIGDPEYDKNCDLNKDGIIDLYDLVRVARKMDSSN